MRLPTFATSPTAIVLAGRAIGQGGFFCFLIGPSLVLSDRDFNELTIGVTIVILAIVAPVNAVQLHFARLPDIASTSRSAAQRSLQLGIACSVVAIVFFAVLTGVTWIGVLLVIGAWANTIPTLVATIHALESRFSRSALVDVTSGVMFAVSSVILISLDAGIEVWAAVYSLTWVLTSIVALAGPLGIRLTGDWGAVGSIRMVLRQSTTMLLIGVIAMAFNRSDYLALTQVGTAQEAARYAIAGRIVGPIYVALGSLNNSLYVRQIALRSDEDAGELLTVRTSRRIGRLAALLVPPIALCTYMLGRLSESFGARDLLTPTSILALSAVVYAFAIPYGFSLAANGNERAWFNVLAVATATDLLLVVSVPRHDATVVATIWLAVQVGVLYSVRRIWTKLKST
jgi:O-antigen/teichoic acid export membrane protein